MIKSILIVDDSPTIRQHIKSILLDDGLILTEATDARAGLSAASRQVFDLIISDVNMPGDDGLTMLKRIRANENNRNTPVFMLTTEERTPELKLRAQEVNVTAWVVKPLNEESFLRGVKMVLAL